MADTYTPEHDRPMGLRPIAWEDAVTKFHFEDVAFRRQFAVFCGAWRHYDRGRAIFRSWIKRLAHHALAAFCVKMNRAGV